MTVTLLLCYNTCKHVTVSTVIKSYVNFLKSLSVCYKLKKKNFINVLFTSILIYARARIHICISFYIFTCMQVSRKYFNDLSIHIFTFFFTLSLNSIYILHIFTYIYILWNEITCNFYKKYVLFIFIKWIF